MGVRSNNRCENSHLPFRRRERAMQLFKTAATLQSVCQLSQSNIQSLQSRKTSSKQTDLQTKTQCRSHGAVPNLRFIGLNDGGTLRRVRLCLTPPYSQAHKFVSGTIGSPCSIFPSSSISARRPPRCTRPRRVPEGVVFCSQAQGSASLDP